MSAVLFAVAPIVSAEKMPPGLSMSEAARLARYGNPLSRAQSLSARLLLGRLYTRLRRDISSLPDVLYPDIVYPDGGKPYFDAFPCLSFNLSHSAGCAAAALSYEADGEAPPLGIDIERERALPRHSEEIVGRYFNAAEQALFTSAQDESDRARLFVRIWTRKEALLKFSGQGLSAYRETDRVGAAAVTAEKRVRVGSSVYFLCLAYPKNINCNLIFTQESL